MVRNRLATFTMAALTALGGLGTAASAADLAAAPQTYQRSPGYVDMTHYTQPWQGFYVGAVGGYGHDSIRFNQFTASGQSLGLPGGFPSEGSLNGATVGLTVGASAEVAHVVFGFEGDLGWAHLTGSQTWGSNSVDAKLDSFSTIRARVGYDLGRFLPFLTAGWGWTHAKMTIPTNAGGTASSVTNEQGFVWGGGLEYAIDSHWSVKGEYLYAKTDAKYAYTTLTPGGAALETTGHLDLFRAGVNYRF